MRAASRPEGMTATAPESAIRATPGLESVTVRNKRW